MNYFSAMDRKNSFMVRICSRSVLYFVNYYRMRFVEREYEYRINNINES